jgi:hypothetical protein
VLHVAEIAAYCNGLQPENPPYTRVSVAFQTWLRYALLPSGPHLAAPTGVGARGCPGTTVRLMDETFGCFLKRTWEEARIYA